VSLAGPSVGFLLTAHRDKKAALRFIDKALPQYGLPQ
jgi:transposase-like protein